MVMNSHCLSKRKGIMHFLSSLRCLASNTRTMDLRATSNRRAPNIMASSASHHHSSTLSFGETHVIQPKGEHRATIVWLHGRGDVGASWAEALEDLPLQNIKWIVPTAPFRPLSVLGGFSCNAWFDGASRFEEAAADVEGLDASATHVAELLSNESPSIKLGIGGFSQGAVTSLYTAVCYVNGNYSNGTPFPCKLSACVALSGWLPKARNIDRLLDDNSEGTQQAKQLPIFIGHGTGDDIVKLKFGEQAADALQSMKFTDVTFKTYNRMGHHCCPSEMNDICHFFRKSLLP